MPPEPLRDALRRTFGGDAALYDRARPAYPPQLFEDLAGLAGLRAGARVLEIGCGTGQATLALAQRGCAVTALDLSPEMARLTRAKADGLPNVQVEAASFEEWPLPARPFDLVVAAQSLHWIDPLVRFRKVAAALRPDGCLVFFGHQHVAGGTREFFVDVQACYERYMPGTPPGLRLAEPSALAYDDLGMSTSGLFEPVAWRRYAWEQEYTAGEYLDVLRTYSNHRLLEAGARHALLACIAELIDKQYAGRIRKAYLTELIVGRLPQ